jgi:hypothetical protein
MAIPIATVLQDFLVKIVQYLPNIVSAILLLLIVLFVGKIIGRVVKQALDKVNLDKYVFETKKPNFSISTMFAIIVKWWIYLAFIAAAFSEEILGVRTLAQWVTTLNDFIPRIVGAAIIIVVGYILAEYIKDQIKKTETIYAGIVGKVTMFFIVYVAVAIALPVLGVPATLVNSILLVIIGSLGIGMAIALGLGMKKPVEQVATKYLKKAKYI